MSTAKIEKEAFIKLCQKIAAEEKVAVELLPITRFGEDFVILRDVKTNTGIARWSHKKTVRLAEYRTERGYSSWMNEIEGKREDLIREIRNAFYWETTPFKYEVFPKFDKCPREDLVSHEEILEWFKKNKIEPTEGTIADNMLLNCELIAPYGCYTTSFANWGAPRTMTAPYPCQQLWAIPEQWGKARNSIIGFEGIGRENAEKSGVKELENAYGWGWERRTGEHSHWTQQMYKRIFKCFFFRDFVKQVYGVDSYSEEGKKIWIVDSLEKVQELWDKAIELGYDYNVKKED